MITKDIVNIYIKLQGNDDALALLIPSSLEKEKLLKNWKLIDDFVFDLNLLNKGLVSQNMEDEIRQRMKKEIDSEDTVELLLSFVKNNS